jgi:hypothetical protein
MRTRAWLAVGVLSVLVVGGCSKGAGTSSAGAKSQVVGAAAGAPRGPSRAATVSLDSALRIRAAQMTVGVQRSGSVGAQADQAILIAQQAGGEVDADDRTSGAHATATLQLRVPPAALEPTLTALAKLGAEQRRQLSTTDVTQRVADVNARVTSAASAIVQLRRLYTQAQKIADVISIENELSKREADLESLQAQQRALSRQTSMATITLTLVTARKHAAAPPQQRHHSRGGFLGGLERGWHGFTAAAGWMADAFGTVLPFLLVLLALGVGVRWLGPRLPRLPRRRAPTPAE